MCPRSPLLRVLLNEPQVVEQLVEVPTLLSVAVLQQRTAEQLASVPVPRGRGQGFLPEQSSIAISSSGKRNSERTVEQIVDISPGGGLAGPADEDFTWVFRIFYQRKKVRHDLRTLGRHCLLMTCLWAVWRSRRRGGRRPSSKRLRLWRGLGCFWIRRARGERGRRGGSGVFRSPRTTPRFAALVVDIWQWLCLVLLVIFPRAVFYCVVGSPKMLVIMAGMFLMYSYAARRLRPSSMPVWHVQGCYCWFFTSRCVPSRGQKVLGYGTEGQLCCLFGAALVVFSGSGMCVAGFPGDDLTRCVPFCGGNAQDARHLGRFGPEGQFSAIQLDSSGRLFLENVSYSAQCVV